MRALSCLLACALLLPGAARAAAPLCAAVGSNDPHNVRIPDTRGDTESEARRKIVETFRHALPNAQPPRITTVLLPVSSGAPGQAISTNPRAGICVGAGTHIYLNVVRPHQMRNFTGDRYDQALKAAARWVGAERIRTHTCGADTASAALAEFQRQAELPFIVTGQAPAEDEALDPRQQATIALHFAPDPAPLVRRHLDEARQRVGRMPPWRTEIHHVHDPTASPDTVLRAWREDCTVHLLVNRRPPTPCTECAKPPTEPPAAPLHPALPAAGGALGALALARVLRSRVPPREREATPPIPATPTSPGGPRSPVRVRLDLP